MVPLIEQPGYDVTTQAPQKPDRLIGRRHFLNRAASPAANLMVVQEWERADGGRYFETFFTAWKGL